VVPGPTAAARGGRGRLAGPARDGRAGDGGFGYDPIFMPDGQQGRTAAELSAEEKNAASHRARAFVALAPLLGALER
jgi:XTP/dITP diphosphohydrolase